MGWKKKQCYLYCFFKSHFFNYIRAVWLSLLRLLFVLSFVAWWWFVYYWNAVMSRMWLWNLVWHERTFLTLKPETSCVFFFPLDGKWAFVTRHRGLDHFHRRGSVQTLTARHAALTVIIFYLFSLSTSSVLAGGGGLQKALSRAASTSLFPPALISCRWALAFHPTVRR